MTKALLIGAGFSADLGMPLVNELSKVFFKDFNNNAVEKLINNLRKTEPYGKSIKLSSEAFDDIMRVFIENDSKNNYEHFIGKIENLEKQKPSNNYLHTVSFFKSILYDRIYDYFVKYQLCSYPIYSIMKSAYSDFCNLISQTEETWVLSLNHDLMIEFLCLDYGIPLSVGYNEIQTFPLDNEKNKNKIISFNKLNRDEFDINKMQFFKKTSGVNLIKLHGGINELSIGDNGNFEYGKNLLFADLTEFKSSCAYEIYVQQINNHMRHYINGKYLPAGKEIVVSNFDGEMEFLRKSILTGGNKFSKKLVEAQGTSMYPLKQVLNKVDELIIIGYSFCDVHINERIDEAMILNPNLVLKVSTLNNIELPRCIDRHDVNGRIKKFIGFKTPEFLHYINTNERNHPQENLLLDYRMSLENKNYNSFLNKYLTKDMLLQNMEYTKYCAENSKK